jgi:predicted RNase H-like nuclease (RuvC/YqgF family)
MMLKLMKFFAPDEGAATAGGEMPAAEQTTAGEQQQQDAPTEDTAGLKSALEKERAARKELQAQLKELRELSSKGAEATKKLQSLERKLAEYEFREKRDAALAKAIEAATKDGRFIVDRDKVAKLAAKLSAADSLEADIAEIVDALKVEAAPKKSDPALKGQPTKAGDGKTTDLPYHEWARLKREDPEAYEAMLRSRRNGVGFRIMGA